MAAQHLREQGEGDDEDFPMARPVDDEEGGFAYDVDEHGNIISVEETEGTASQYSDMGLMGVVLRNKGLPASYVPAPARPNAEYSSIVEEGYDRRL